MRISIVVTLSFLSVLFAQTQLGSDIDGEAAYDESGYSVSMNSAGDRVAIGAYMASGTGSVILLASSSYSPPSCRVRQ